MKRRVSATDALSAQGKEMAASQRMLLLLYGLAIKVSTSEWWSRRVPREVLRFVREAPTERSMWCCVCLFQ